MQKRSFFFSFAFFVAATFYVGYYLFYIVPSDIKKYQMEEERTKNLNRKENRSVDGTQNRELTTKEIYSSDFPFRLHTHLEAKSSVLHFFSKEGRLHVKENLSNIAGEIEEKILINELGEEQKIFKIIHAESGIYDYQKKELITKAIYVEQRKEDRARGSILKKNASSIYRAKANQASIKIDGSSPYVHADRLEMTLHRTDFNLK